MGREASCFLVSLLSPTDWFVIGKARGTLIPPFSINLWPRVFFFMVRDKSVLPQPVNYVSGAVRGYVAHVPACRDLLVAFLAAAEIK